MKISQETIDEVARVGREYPDGIHTCAELQRLEPGRRPCTCGGCPKWELWQCQPMQPNDARLAVGTEEEVKRAAQALVDEAHALDYPLPEMVLRTDLYLAAPDNSHRGQRCDCPGEAICWIDVDW
jgi:hypothetical protein